MFERYTEKARRSVFFARYEAAQGGSETILPGHFLLGLFREDRPLARTYGIEDLDAFRAEVNKPGAPKVSLSVDLPISDRVQRALVYGAEEAEKRNDLHIGTEHLLMGILREDDEVAARFLRDHGATLEELPQRSAQTASDSGAQAMNVAEVLKRVLGRIGSGGLQKTGDEKNGRFSATQTQDGVRTVISHNFLQGHEIQVTETMRLTPDGKSLHYTIEIQGPGQQHRHEIDFPIA